MSGQSAASAPFLVPPDLPISHPEKVLFPNTGFTKADMIRYYWAVAPAMLPHLRERPITLVRWPEGVRGEYFFEKDAPAFTPGWVKTGEVSRTDEDKRPIRYILVNDAKTLLWVANLASIEIHPFLHRFPRIERPTHLAFDLDPGEGAGLLECIEVAWALKERLAGMDLECWPKVTGSKGLQVYMPLNTAVTYAEATPFAQALARELERAMPGLVVSNMSKALRKRKVLVDWSQNHAKKTTVAVYSLRAKRDEPFVSAPVTWRELDNAHTQHAPDSLFFTPIEVIQRLRRRGDLFEPILLRKQRLPTLRSSVSTVRRSGSKKEKGFRLGPAHAGGAAPGGAAGEPNLKTPGLVEADASGSERTSGRLRFVEPMLARGVAELPAGREWMYEIKWDGYRVEALKSGDEVRLISRKGKDLTQEFPSVKEAVQAVPAGTALIDGEVVALDDSGHPRFQLLQNRGSKEGHLVLYAFDLLECDGEDLRTVPLERRKRRLSELIAAMPVGGVRFSASLRGSPARISEHIRRLGLEGIVAKRRDSLYESGERSGAWVKFKLSPEQEFVVGGYNPGRPLESLIVGTYDAEGRLLCAGKVRQGLNPRNRVELARRLDRLRTARCPFANLPNFQKSHWGEGITAEQMAELRWAKPRLVAQIRFTEWTQGGNLRHGEYLGLRTDKDPKEVVRETPAGVS